MEITGWSPFPMLASGGGLTESPPHLRTILATGQTGAAKELPTESDVRVIAAANHDLREGVAQWMFRQDLFYRLSMVEIHVPFLEERKEDLPLLTAYFIEKFAIKEIRGITQRAHCACAT